MYTVRANSKGDAEEPVDMVYSLNAEYGTTKNRTRSGFSPGMGERLWSQMKSDPRYESLLTSFSSESPNWIVLNCRLRISLHTNWPHEFENRIARPNDGMRHGLREILGMQAIPVPRIDLLDRKELLYLVKLSGFLDQTGVEEADEMVALSAKQAMVKWMQERGGVASEMHITWDEESFLKRPGGG